MSPFRARHFAGRASSWTPILQRTVLRRLAFHLILVHTHHSLAGLGPHAAPHPKQMYTQQMPDKCQQRNTVLLLPCTATLQRVIKFGRHKEPHLTKRTLQCVACANFIELHNHHHMMPELRCAQPLPTLACTRANKSKRACTCWKCWK